MRRCQIILPINLASAAMWRTTPDFCAGASPFTCGPQDVTSIIYQPTMFSHDCMHERWNSPLSFTRSLIPFKKAKQWEIPNTIRGKPVQPSLVQTVFRCINRMSNVQVYVRVNGDEPTPMQPSQRVCRVRYEYDSSTVEIAECVVNAW